MGIRQTIRTVNATDAINNATCKVVDICVTSLPEYNPRIALRNRFIEIIFLERDAQIDASGSFWNDFAAIFTVTNTVGMVINHLDVGGATNTPARYCRVWLAL